MAERPLFLPDVLGKSFVKTVTVSFKWHPGMAKVQKQKSIAAMHEAIRLNHGLNNILEISSKSPLDLGVKLSAFNLLLTSNKYNKTFSVESAFQSSKVFEKGGPFVDLLDQPSIKAKKDPRLKQYGKLKFFKFLGTQWSLKPSTMFYDWLYINALLMNKQLADQLKKYDGFTDIEFNPQKSINCQAKSAAMFVSLSKRGLIENTILSSEDFKLLMKRYSVQGEDNISHQHNLFY